MTVNYYAFGPFPGGSPNGEGLHVGQSAAGLRFLFRAHPDLGLTTHAEWLAFITRPDVEIRTEAARDVTAEEMQDTMTETTDGRGLPLRQRFRFENKDRYITAGGHAFYLRDFY
ncbi:hypothetical protein [Streptomyces sp. NPDC008150]|uniref:hypothetical protein n=1 Tax=Streptomyces sp. NPDC008150 TaxID=3364816 RepID=UPI0036E2DD8C